jgi:hypothetical protein
VVEGEEVLEEEGGVLAHQLDGMVDLVLLE